MEIKRSLTMALHLLSKEDNNSVKFVENKTTFKLIKYSPNSYMLSRVIKIDDKDSEMTENIMMFNPTLFKEKFLDTVIDSLI